jgi:hypothetical protein
VVEPFYEETAFLDFELAVHPGLEVTSLLFLMF